MSGYARLIRALLVTLAAAVILLALGVGALKIGLSQLPSYQLQLEARIGQALGVEFDFERLDARLGFAGPELTFHHAEVSAPGDAEPFIVARRASIVIDLWALAERELRAKRLVFDGTHLHFSRRADGRVVLDGAPVGGEGIDFALLFPADVAIAVRDGRLDYTDPARGISWAFSDVELDFTRHAGLLEAGLRASPPAVLGERIELALNRSLADDGVHRAAVTIRDGDFAEVAAALPSMSGLPSRGRGNLSALAQWHGSQLMTVATSVELGGVGWSSYPGEGYDHLALDGEWRRTDAGWQLAFENVSIRRGERAWPAGAGVRLDVAVGDDGRIATVAADGSFLRLEDLEPIVAALPGSAFASRWLDLSPRGDVRDLDAAVSRRDEALDYVIAARFDGLGIDADGRWPRVDGLSGVLRADRDSGRVGLDAHAVTLDWPQLFRRPMAFDEVAGLFVWREGADAVRVVSDDLAVANADFSANASLELALPLAGGSPEIDLNVETGAFQARAVTRYLPAHSMRPVVLRWLDNAIQGGVVHGVDLELSGPLAAFPFDGGEGRFRAVADVEEGVLEYAPGWPRAEGLTGRIVFENAGFTAVGDGRVLGNVGEDVEVGIADMRRAVLQLDATSRGPLADLLAFLRGAPQIAAHLGPGYDHLEAPAGEALVNVDLALPLYAMRDYRVDAAVEIADGTLSINGFGPQVSDIHGMLRLHEGELAGERIEAVFLEGPLLVNVVPAQQPGYRSRLAFEGEVTAGAVIDAFALGVQGGLAGQTRWRGELLIPARFDNDLADAPLQVVVASNLSGVASSLPAPLGKRAGDATALRLAFSIDGEHVEVDGHVGPTRELALTFARDAQGDLEFARGAVRLGGGTLTPALDGLAISGSLPELDLDAWAAFLRTPRSAATSGTPTPDLAERLARIDLEVADLKALGQSLGPTQIGVESSAGGWRLEVDSAPAAGVIQVPRNVGRRGTIVARMSRLHLAPADGRTAADAVSADPPERIDPRGLPALDIVVDDFRFGARRFGAFSADVRADPLGLRVASFESRSPSFRVSGSGGWFDGPTGPSTRIALHMTAGDVGAALADLALDPIASGEMADITASVHWPGAPNDDWMRSLEGDLSLRLERGSLLDIDPGAGRVVGLMSISALPRRLALDFRDVFNKGLVFDELGGDFTIIAGNAYTDNFKVAGPAAEIGLAGRIGLRDRDYRQQAVITAEPGNMLPTVGGLIGGPGVGAALLIFTRIFKEPLKGIGRASYCITGSWDAPTVERLTAEQLDSGELCVDLPPGAGVSQRETIGAQR